MIAAPPRRKAITLRTKLAAALCTLLEIPHDHAKAMHEEQILSLVQWDHYPLRHADGGPDAHWNLRPLLIAEHDFKTFKNNGTGRGDATDMAHDRAMIRKQHEHGERMAAKLYGETKSVPKRRARKLQGRGFAKGHRPLRSRSFQRR